MLCKCESQQGAPLCPSLSASHLLLDVNHMEDVTKVKQFWRGHRNNLKEPEANVRDREGKVVAHVLTAGLLSIADEVGLLISPHLERHDMTHDGIIYS